MKFKGRRVLPACPAWFVVDEDGWPIKGPYTKREGALNARERVDTTRELRVIAYDPRLANPKVKP